MERGDDHLPLSKGEVKKIMFYRSCCACLHDVFLKGQFTGTFNVHCIHVIVTYKNGHREILDL
jgi:hypothetical protein